MAFLAVLCFGDFYKCSQINLGGLRYVDIKNNLHAAKEQVLRLPSESEEGWRIAMAWVA